MVSFAEWDSMMVSTTVLSIARPPKVDPQEMGVVAATHTA